MSMARGSRMLRYINYRMRITIQDSRVLVGTFMAFDRHMNIVLGDTEEFRKIKRKKGSGLSEEREEKRSLGLIVLRGDSVVSMTIEGPPPAEAEDPVAVAKGAAAARAVAGAMPLLGAPVGLAGPVRGVGGPAMSLMQPPPMQVAAHAPVGGLPPPGAMGGLPPRPGMPMGLPPMMPPRMPPGMPPMMPRGLPGMPPPPAPK